MFLVKEEGKNTVAGGGVRDKQRRVLYSKLDYFHFELPVSTNRYNGSHEEGT